MSGYKSKHQLLPPQDPETILPFYNVLLYRDYKRQHLGLIQEIRELRSEIRFQKKLIAKLTMKGEKL